MDPLQTPGVRIVSENGAELDLRPVGYQFPKHAPEDDRDYDANWLNVSGSVRLPDGRAWQFVDPCLTTWDAQHLAQWLRSAAEGRVTPASSSAEAPREVFFEPNIAFDVALVREDRIELRAYFSLESLPPWQRDENQPDIWELFVPLEVSAEELRRAAEEWERETASFPVRARKRSRWRRLGR
jgi:hypothetical protein